MLQIQSIKDQQVFLLLYTKVVSKEEFKLLLFKTESLHDMRKKAQINFST